MHLLLDQHLDNESAWRACERRLKTLFATCGVATTDASQVRNIVSVAQSKREGGCHVHIERLARDLKVVINVRADEEPLIWHFDNPDFVSTIEGNTETVSVILRGDSKSKRHHIAVVDDDRLYRVLIENYLSAEFDVSLFENGREALEGIADTEPDLVLCDIEMPLMNGWELRHALLSKKSTAAIPFVFLTGNDDDVQQAQASGSAVDDFLSKPIQKVALTNCINRVLTRVEHLKQQLSDRLDERITRRLAPETPSVRADYSAALFSRCHSAGGGDFLFARETEDGQTLIVLGDVMGHDEAAHFFCYAHMGFLYGLFHAGTPPESPAQCLELLNTAMLNHNLYSESMVTLTAALLGPDGKVAVACAGHPPPIVLKPNGELHELEVSGCIPGVIEHTEYIETEVTLDSRERLLLYSDGLFDALQNDLSIQEALTEVQKVLQGNAESEVGKLVEAVEARFTSADLGDDVTLLALEAAA
ncbi:MAG: fused response regulator/phosphatase [Pseudomonadota bacterium]